MLQTHCLGLFWGLVCEPVWLPLLPGATVSLCSAGVCRPWDLGGCLFCGCECCITACVSGRHVTVWCCMGDSRLCDMFCDFLGDSAVGCVCMCVCVTGLCVVVCTLVPWGPPGVCV